MCQDQCLDFNANCHRGAFQPSLKHFGDAFPFSFALCFFGKTSAAPKIPFFYDTQSKLTLLFLLLLQTQSHTFQNQKESNIS